MNYTNATINRLIADGAFLDTHGTVWLDAGNLLPIPDDALPELNKDEASLTYYLAQERAIVLENGDDG